ncbi:MAG: hypothetical protein M3324_12270 [Actinomycetota bacterium]|nr:hypothetical protein [Actinomycetota bacterium]
MSGSVLLVIGNDEERLHLRRALSGEGWRVIPAGSGAQARQMAERQDFEVAVVDNRLPDERGFQVISAVRKPGVDTVALLHDEDTMDRIVGIELGGLLHALAGQPAGIGGARQADLPQEGARRRRASG